MDIKSAVCIDKNGKDNNQTRHIARRVHVVNNFENCKMHKIDWCEGGLQLEEIYTNNVGDYDLNPRMKYIMVRLYNWDRTIVQEGWKNTGYSMEQEFYMARLYWVEVSTQSVWNVCIKFDTQK